MNDFCGQMSDQFMESNRLLTILTLQDIIHNKWSRLIKHSDDLIMIV